MIWPRVLLSVPLADCVECMACSDNVLRAGLTPKFVDAAALSEMLDYRSRRLDAYLFAGERAAADPAVTVFNPPVDDFTVASIQVQSTHSSTYSKYSYSANDFTVARIQVQSTQAHNFKYSYLCKIWTFYWYWYSWSNYSYFMYFTSTSEYFVNAKIADGPRQLQNQLMEASAFIKDFTENAILILLISTHNTNYTSWGPLFYLNIMFRRFLLFHCSPCDVIKGFKVCTCPQIWINNFLCSLLLFIIISSNIFAV